MTNDSRHSWYGIEAKRNGYPELVRARKVTACTSKSSTNQDLVIVTREYVSHDTTLLPSKEAYEDITRFEDSVLDEVEKQRLGLLVWIQTGQGKTRYYLYVRDVSSVLELIKSKTNSGEDECVDFSPNLATNGQRMKG